MKDPDQYQFFVSNGNELCIYNQKEETRVLQQIQKKLKGNKSIVHSAYILGDLHKPWQRKMFIQEFYIADQINALYFIFHLHESDILYNNLNSMLSSDTLQLRDSNCQFALEITSRRLKDPKTYVNSLLKYKKLGILTVLDTAHIVSSGLYKVIKPKKQNDNRSQIEQVTSFIKKYGNSFDILHFADQSTQFDSGKDIHIQPFGGGMLFQFAHLFTSIDLLDALIKQYSTMVIEFVDKGRLFRRALQRYVDKVLYINREHLELYTQILSWYSNQLDDSVDDISTSFQIQVYQAMQYQLQEICRQTDESIKIDSILWKKYGLSHKIAQLLFIVELTSYFFINGIIPPWDNTNKKSRSSEKEHSRALVDQYIKKFISLKIIKSKKQVYGSYLRGNEIIGDLDILIDIKDKQRVFDILKSNIKQSQYDRKYDDFDISVDRDYSILRLFLDNKINIDIYFAKLPNPAIELFLTGSKYFNIFLRKRAHIMGFKLSNTELLTRSKTDDSWVKVSVKSQQDIFRKLKMKAVPPQFRVFYSDPHYVYIDKV